jgi:hypothetical protein
MIPDERHARGCVVRYGDKSQTDQEAADCGCHDPCGEAMKPHMERMLRELAADGPPHSEWERLKRIEAAAREVIKNYDDFVYVGQDIGGDGMCSLHNLRKALEK